MKATAFNILTEPGSDGTLSAYNLDFVEISTMATYKLFNNPSIGLGYLYRWSEPFEQEDEFEHRLMEQIGFISMKGSVRMGHRIRLEQRWKSEGLIHRFRYRFSIDKPLMGESLDPNEPYIIGANELLFSAGLPISFFAEYRIGGGIGWFFSRNSKLEIQPQYRLNGILEDDLVHFLVLYTTFYMNF
ncbi:MAG: DUF2490 domain-containing protein [Cyclobacteriaceae bacterium]|nr:DUF2490 domain-containing protein [Cyclobacteriaceae bacterium]